MLYRRYQRGADHTRHTHRGGGQWSERGFHDREVPNPYFCSRNPSFVALLSQPNQGFHICEAMLIPGHSGHPDVVGVQPFQVLPALGSQYCRVYEAILAALGTPIWWGLCSHFQSSLPVQLCPKMQRFHVKLLSSMACQGHAIFTVDPFEVFQVHTNG